MPFAIVADLPLGTYHGAGQDGRPEPMPSVARLHSALLCAAGFGPRAVSTGPDSLEVKQEDLAALRWLEENPPDSVQIPALAVNVSRPVAYRDDGTIFRKKAVARIKKLDKSPGGGTAVAGQFAWIWTEIPPPGVRECLEQLCPDVASLGTSESPVRLTAAVTGDVKPTAFLDPHAGMFTVGVTAQPRPVRGRTAELVAAHRAATGRPPSAARDKVKTDEDSMSAVPPRSAVSPAWYRPRDREPAQAPWPVAITLPLSCVVGPEQRVGWAVAAHRALVRLIGYGAPALVTGAYPAGTARPENRLAIQVLGPETPAAPVPLRHRAGRPESALLLLVPAGADASDLQALQRAVSGLRSLRGPGGIQAKIDPAGIKTLNGGDFWLPPAPGRLRLWETVPAAVPDTRGYEGWTFADAALLSLAFVWKAFLPLAPGRGEQRGRNLAAAAADRGAAVVQVRAERTSQVGLYAHKVNQHAVIRPYSAILTLGDLGGDRVVQAIGQSRHLGGGLLVPRDVARMPEQVEDGDAHGTS